MPDIHKILKIGILNTFRLNIHYFGLDGLLCPRILVSRHVKIKTMSGEVKAPRKMGCVQLGLYEIGTVDGRYQRCVWENTGTIYFTGKTLLGQGTKISNHGELVFGAKTLWSGNSAVICHKKITMGAEAYIGWDTQIMDTDFHKIVDRELDDSNGAENATCLNPPKDVVIGDHCWIGCRCLILKGTYLPSNSIVAAASTISRTFSEEYTLLKDNQVIRENVAWQY